MHKSTNQITLHKIDDRKTTLPSQQSLGISALSGAHDFSLLIWCEDWSCSAALKSVKASRGERPHCSRRYQLCVVGALCYVCPGSFLPCKGGNRGPCELFSQNADHVELDSVIGQPMRADDAR